MKYEIQKDKIIIEDLTDFNIEHILECGQVFTYKKLENNKYEVYSGMHYAVVEMQNNKYIITTNNPAYFVNYFDLDTDYSLIKSKLIKNEDCKNAVEYGYGIRILKQDILEVIIGFILSSNNNIERIKNSMAKLRLFGKDCGTYHAFPTLNELKNLKVEDFKNIGAGYRANYLTKVVSQLSNVDLQSTYNMSTEELKSWLLSLCGVGPKVADCILLFGYSRCNSFPVDTWIEKVYYDIFKTTKSNVQMSKDLVDLFGELSGYAQQYLFFYKRNFEK